MIHKAEQALDEGKLDLAQTMFERAQRMSQKSPHVDYRFARLRMKQENWHQAKQLCYKALSLTGNNSAYRNKILERIANINESQGDVK